MNNSMQDSQAAFAVIQNLAPLCATDGVEPETKKEVNVLLRSMLEVIKSASQTMTAKSSGLIV